MCGKPNSFLLANSGFLLLHLGFLRKFPWLYSPQQKYTEMSHRLDEGFWKTEYNVHNMGLHRGTKITRAVEGSYDSTWQLAHRCPSSYSLRENLTRSNWNMNQHQRELKKTFQRDQGSWKQRSNTKSRRGLTLKHGTLFVKLTDNMSFA